MPRRLALPALALSALLAPLAAARGDFLYGIDPGKGPFAPRPLADAARDAYIAGTAGADTRLITFEGLPGAGNPGLLSTAIPVGQGVTVETSNFDPLPPPGFQYGLTNIPNASAVQSNARLGYNISGDARFTFVPILNAGTASLIFRSVTAFNSFGMYLTGLGNESGRLELVLDGVSMTVVDGSSDGGVLFVGYLGDPEVRFHTLELRVTGIVGPNRDVFAVDDVRFSLGAVPEPQSLLMLGSGGALCLLAARRGHRRRPGRRPPDPRERRDA